MVTGWPKVKCSRSLVAGQERFLKRSVVIYRGRPLFAPKGLHDGSPEGPVDVLWGPESGTGW